MFFFLLADPFDSSAADSHEDLFHGKNIVDEKRNSQSEVQVCS